MRPRRTGAAVAWRPVNQPSPLPSTAALASPVSADAAIGSAGAPLKIGLVSDCYVPRLGGIEMQVHDLARHLQAIGHDVVVITPSPGPTEVDGIRVRRVSA